MVNKKSAIIITSIILLLAIVITAVTIFLHNKSKNKLDAISNVEVAKMITLAKMSESELIRTSQSSDWYDAYMNYMYIENIFDKEKTKATSNGKYTALLYSDFKNIVKWASIDVSQLEKELGFKLDKKKDNALVERNDFLKAYELILKKIDVNGAVKLQNRVILGNSNNIEGLSATEVYTTEGSLNAFGINVDDKVDKKVELYLRDNEIVYITKALPDEILYENVWIVLGEGKSVYTFMYDVFRTFNVESLESKIESTLGDIVIKDGKVFQINKKEDTVRGKVLKVTKDVIEIEGYGSIPISNNYKIYKNYGKIETKSLDDIVIGYELQDFIVANGQMCGAIITKPLEADNIRVIVTDTNNSDSNFHSSVTFSATSDFVVKYGELEKTFTKGEKVQVDASSEPLKEGRIKIVPLTTGGKVTIESIKKNYGTPSYYGTMEIVNHEKGLLVINEIFIEEYLYGVVPNEMPVSYGLEALKVQAVCARSYAYNQLRQNRLREYGAHVNDTVSFQAYNNYKEQLVSNEAVRQTYGQVLKKGEDVVTTYYYSTSCGYTTDLNIWHTTNPDDYIYAVRLNPDRTAIDLTSEENFAAFIKNPQSGDYETEFALYRWNVKLDLAQISTMVNARLGARYNNSKSYILTLENGKYVSKEISDIGNITRIETVKRLDGGVLDEIILHGTKATVKVINQANIRHLLGSKSLKLNNHLGGNSYTSDLPSAFVYLEPYYEGENLAGYTLYGGGYGHGAGMSQNGAYAMTKAGMTYEQILYLFYRNTKIECVY